MGDRDPGQTTLNEVAKRASVCPACKLSQTRKFVVFGEGDPHAKLMFIGEGPGEREDATGRPFVGRAGALLDRALRENGLHRPDVYIANIVKCRPVLMEDGRARNRPPEQEEIDACRPWLESQVQLIQPKVILCLGSPSANTIIHKNFKITLERGQFFTSQWAKSVIATLHPAYVLRLMGDPHQTGYKALVEDIAKAYSKANEEIPVFPGEDQLSLF